MVSHLWINKKPRESAHQLDWEKPPTKLIQFWWKLNLKNISNWQITIRKKTPVVFMLFLLTLKHVNYRHGNTFPHALLYSPRCQRKLKPYWKKKLKSRQAPAFICAGDILYNYVYALYIYTLKYLKGKEYFSKSELYFILKCAQLP